MDKDNHKVRDTINKRGNKKARRLLFWVVMNIIRGQHHYDNHVVDYYYKLENSLMRKLTRLPSSLVLIVS